jgi:hypothetical protein
MKHKIYTINLIAIIALCTIVFPAVAESPDYLTGFKVPVQQTFCISKSANGDMNAYKQCMLAIEKGSYKCDMATKPAYDKLMERYSDYDKDLSKFMDDINPITKIHFDCLNSLY